MMKPLILCGENGTHFERSGRTEAPVTFLFRFAAGKLPSPEELAFYLDELTENHERGCHWSTYTYRWHDERFLDHSLYAVCDVFETVELWFDPAPNDQLQLIWLLDQLAPDPEVVAKLKLRIVDFDLLMEEPEELAVRKVVVRDVGYKALETASRAWQAYRSATPQACFDLLTSDLSALPLLRPALLDLLEELPSAITGLGATEMRLLELIANGYSHMTPLCSPYQGLRQRRVFDFWETGRLLEGLAHGPQPAIAGLDDELRAMSKDDHNARDEAYRRSRLWLTEFGKAVLAHKADFSRHNPIDRWWGGTHLTNDNLWRWNPALVAP
jgi:hypothetical protein